MRYTVSISGRERELEINQRGEGFECRLDGEPIDVEVTRVSSGVLSILYQGKSYVVRREAGGAILIGEHTYEVQLTDPRSWRSRHPASGAGSGPQKLTAFMPGKVVRVLAQPGAAVLAGQGVVIVEAMKMQNEVRSPRDGRIVSIQVKEGQAVNAGEVVAVLE